MNNEPKTFNQVTQILDQLDMATASLSTSQLLFELQVIVERLSFTKLDDTIKQCSQENLAKIDLLFDGEISNGMLSFVHWLAKYGILKILVDDTGCIFLNYCIKKYKQIPEIKFIAPIQLSDETKCYILKQLRLIYPQPARIIHEVAPSLSAGFIIQNGAEIIDRSLRSKIIQSVKPYILKQYQSSVTNHE